MNSKTQHFRILALTALLGIAAFPWLQAKSSTYVHSELPDGADWGGTSWTASQEHLFAGEPAFQDPGTTTILVRYSYYVSQYDTVRLNPVWVAHIDTADSAAATATRTDGVWDRKHYHFRPDANVVTFSMARKIPWVKDTDYTNANPSELKPVTSANRISRGHLASNQEMKGHGDETEGQLSQTESFSFANVAPQMQAFNAPFWLAIEEDCLRLAETVGTVAVISGPVFKPEKGEPLLQTGSGTKVRIPIPTHFFKVIIARVDGRTTAIAFLVPHRADLKAEARSNYLVPVRAVEDVTGINFMPELGSNDALEKVPQQELVELLHDD